MSDDAVDDEPYELPEIVPATDDREPMAAEPEQLAPVLPPRATAPAPSLPPDTRRGRPITTEHPAAPSRPAPAPAEPTAPVRTTPPAPSSPVRPTSEPLGAARRTPPVSGATSTGWSEHPVTARSGATPLRAPGRRPRVRRVTRVLRHVDPWSTFKIALLFSAVGYVVALTSGVLLWRVADSTGTLANIERWFTQFGWETFELKGSEVFHNAWIIGLFGVVAATGGAVLLATLFNLVSDIVGGIRVTVLEEEVVERTISSTRRYVVRRPPADVGGAATTSDWSIDDDSDASVEAGPVSADSNGADSSGPDSNGPDSNGGGDRPAPGAPTASTPPPRADDDWSVD